MTSDSRVGPMPAAGRAGIATGRWTGMARFVGVVLALHAPSWLTAWLFQSPRAEERPVFNVDLLAAAALGCVSTLAGAAGLLIAWAADFIRAAAKNYHFMSAMDFVDAVRFVDMLDVRMFLSAPLLGAALGLAACAWWVLRWTRGSRKLALPLLGVAVMATGGDLANGTFHGFGLDKDSRMTSLNLAGSPAWNVWRSEWQALRATGAPSPLPAPVAYDALRAWQDAHPGSTSLLVLVESMGLPQDPALRAWLEGQLMTPRLAARWTMGATQEAFVGSTTYGELRTLCGVYGHYARLDEPTASGCLPRALASKGVHSVGLHGFGLRMFDRHAWWPRIGLQPWHWRPAAAGTPMHCNAAFPGVCDREVLEQAVAQAQHPARFVYALTLDTHLPLPRSADPVPPDLQAACQRAAATAAACQMVHRLGRVLGTLETLLAASASAPFVAVVGDHAPAFAESANRAAFVPDQVPTLLLAPRDPR